MSDEILEVEIELGDGSKQKLSIKEIDVSEWEEIEKGKRGILTLVNGQQMLIEINEANYEGISFKTIGGSQLYFHEDIVIRSLFVEQ